MKAYELDPDMFPQREVVKAYQDVGHEYERTTTDRVYQTFYSLVTADPVRHQQIEKKIQGCYRSKDNKGEWLYYHVLLLGRDWKLNKKDFNYVEGLIEGMPTWHKEIEPSTGKVISGTTQIEEVNKIHTIPWTKVKFDEISRYFTDTVFFVVVDRSGRKYSCNAQEFKNLGYDELVDLKTGRTEYLKERQRQGGVITKGIG
jgi:hypothetical protein